MTYVKRVIDVGKVLTDIIVSIIYNILCCKYRTLPIANHTARQTHKLSRNKTKYTQNRLTHSSAHTLSIVGISKTENDVKENDVNLTYKLFGVMFDRRRRRCCRHIHCSLLDVCEFVVYTCYTWVGARIK